MASPLARLADWFHAQCDGDWEHGCGFRIETLDNPGWFVRIELEGTSLEDVVFEVTEDQSQHESERLRCWKEGAVFKIACGPGRLEDALRVFLDWADAAGGGAG